MTVTISEGRKGIYVELKSKHKEFIEFFGEVETTKTGLFEAMEKISTWGNNIIGEEVLFETV